MYALCPDYISVVPGTDQGMLTLSLEQLPRNDHLFQAAGGHIVLSERARSIVNRYSICPTVSWSRFRLVVSGQEPVACFSIKGEQIRIVDRDNSEIDWILEGKVIRQIVRWVFLVEPPFDFFYSDASEWLVKDGLAENLAAELACSLRKCAMK